MRKRLMFVAGLAVGYVLGTRAGRERYEQMRKSAQQFAQNPAVRNTAESAALTGRKAAVKVVDSVAVRVGDRMPPSVAERVRTLREGRTGYADDWGSGTP